MKKERTMTLGMLNVKIHPHSPEQYTLLLRQAYQSRGIVKIRGIDGGTIGFLRSAAADNMLYGVAWRFVNLDPSQKWADILKGRVLDPDTDATPQIPAEYKPHLKEARFAFYPKNHRLVFDTENLPPATAQKLFAAIFSSPDIRESFGEVTVIVEQSVEAIDAILSIGQKSRISIFISRPNGDDMNSKRELFLKRLENQNVKAIREDLKGDRSGNIQPDEETVALMRIARTDGHVSVTGRDENQRRKTVSTKQHPMLHHGRVDCEADEIDEFERIAYAFNEICQRQIEDNL